MEELPKISIVIPVRNEARYIAATIDYLLKQDYPADKMEILVADSGSDDGTSEIVTEIAAKDPRVRFLNNPGRLSSAGRNVGAKNASGEIITFVDGHTYIDNNQLLSNTARLMSEKGVSVLSRPQLLDTPGNSSFQRAVALARRSVIGHGLDSTIYLTADKYVNPSSSGASYKREIFEKIGYYDEAFDACEDVEFNCRAAQNKYKSFSSMKLAVYYYPRDSFRALFKQLKRYGIGRFRLAKKHPGTLSLGTLIPVLIAFGVPLLGILSIFLSFLQYPFFLSAGLIITAVLGWSLVIGLKEGVEFIPLLPFVYLTVYGGLGCGFVLGFFEALRGEQVRNSASG
jgi:succinoglycan biosynthesis protein ExoA